MRAECCTRTAASLRRIWRKSGNWPSSPCPARKRCSEMRVLSLCSGYGGIERGLEMVADAELAYVADNSPGAARILNYRFPGVPNLGSLEQVDWAEEMMPG